MDKMTIKGLGLGLFIIITTIVTNACVHAPYIMPVSQRTGDPTICFDRDILPIFVSNCTQSGCHAGGGESNGYRLDNYADIVSKGIVPGNPAASKLFESVAYAKGSSKMPRGGSSLNASQIDLLRRWIATGAIDGGACTGGCDSNNFTYSGAIAPMMNTYCVGCHNSASVKGGSMSDYNNVKTQAVSGKMIGNIEHLAGFVPMPSAGLLLSDCQIAQVKKWVAVGALNN
jgi:Planctomycete cytochrome C